MSVIFDYSTYVKNSLQIAHADTAALISSETEADYYETYTSQSIDAPSDDVFFYSYVNPGHTGTATAIELYWKANITFLNSGGAPWYYPLDDVINVSSANPKTGVLASADTQSVAANDYLFLDHTLDGIYKVSAVSVNTSITLFAASAATVSGNYWYECTIPADTLTLKVQMLPNGGAWTDIYSFSGSLLAFYALLGTTENIPYAAPYPVLHTVYTSTNIQMPAALRVTASLANHSMYLTIGNSYPMSIRCIGTV